MTISYTVPGLKTDTATDIVETLQIRLHALNDLALTLKHIHWNVVGPQFIAVHTMLDPQVDGVRVMVDDVAERIATLGGSPTGTPGALVDARTWDDYSIGRDDAIAHLAALDLVYTGVIEDTAPRSTRPRSPTPSPRTCSSARPATSSSTSGSSAPTWRTPTARCAPPAPGARPRPPVRSDPSAQSIHEIPNAWILR